MAWAEVLDEESFSVGVATQSTINTAGSSWTWIDCEMPQVSYDAAQVETKRSRRSRGAASKRSTGKVWPRVAVKFRVAGQLAAYAFASDTPGLKSQNLLLDFLGGSSAVTYQAACITTTDANTFSLVTSAGKLGCLIAAREATGVVNAMGFAKTVGSGGPFVTDLFEDLRVVSGSAVARLPTFNAYPSTTAPSPITIRVCGEHVDMERRYIGCILSKASFSYDADWRLWCTAEFIAYGGEPAVRTTGGGGLQVVAETLALEPLVARGGARFVVASNAFTTFNNASVDVDGTPDIRDVELNWEIPHYVATGPTGTEGVYTVVTRSPIVSAAFSVPDISDFHVSSEHFAEAAWRNQSALSLTCYMGDTPGQLCAWSIRSGIVTGFPEPVQVDGIRHRRVNIEAGYWSGDAASTDAGNKSHVFCLG